MKKIVILFFLFTFAAPVFAQETAPAAENELKSFRFGLKATPSLNWYKPDDKKKFESGGICVKFAYGLVTDFRLSRVISFATGLQVDYNGGRINFIDTVKYFYADGEVITSKMASEKVVKNEAFETFKLNKRKYNVTYVTIPITLKMGTKEIGYMRYFGQFGSNVSFKVKTKSTDAVTTEKGMHTEQENIDITDDMNLLNLALNIGAGCEYNLSGSTSVFFALNYYNGFSNVLKKESKYLIRTNGNPVIQNANSNAIALTVGVLF